MHFSTGIVLCVIISSVCFHPVAPKVYTKCGLTQELLNLGFPRSFIGNWVCLIESESAKNTSKVTDKANGGKALGLFQISSKDWCTFQRAGGRCNLKCEDLINENISDDARCAKRVHGESGFQGWEGWKRSCYGRTLPIPPC